MIRKTLLVLLSVGLVCGLALVLLLVLMRRARQTKTAVGVPATYNEPMGLMCMVVMLVWLIVGTG